MLHFERVGGFADLTLKGLPVQRDQVVITLGLHFGRLPRFQAVQMHESHSPRTLAGRDQWVLITLLIRPAEATMISFSKE